MRSARTSQAAEATPHAQPDAQPLPVNMSLGQLAHELNSLLDGSMRCLSMARQALSQPATADIVASEEAAARLEAAQRGLQQMAGVLRRVMQGAASGLDLFDADQSLKTLLHQVVDAVGSLASESHVAVQVHLSQQAAALPAGPLACVMLNGMRNAIQACAAVESLNRQATLTATITPSDHLLIVIADSGPGLSAPLTVGAKPGSHGMGLDLCRSIVAGLGGALCLADSPSGCGAVFQVTIPVRRLVGHG